MFGEGEFFKAAALNGAIVRDARQGQQLQHLQSPTERFIPIQCSDGTRISYLLTAHDAVVQRIEIRPSGQLRRKQVEQICWQHSNIGAVHDRAIASILAMCLLDSIDGHFFGRAAKRWEVMILMLLLLALIDQSGVATGESSSGRRARRAAKESNPTSSTTSLWHRAKSRGDDGAGLLVNTRGDGARI